VHCVDCVGLLLGPCAYPERKCALCVVAIQADGPMVDCDWNIGDRTEAAGRVQGEAAWFGGRSAGVC